MIGEKNTSKFKQGDIISPKSPRASKPHFVYKIFGINDEFYKVFGGVEKTEMSFQIDLVDKLYKLDIKEIRKAKLKKINGNIF